MKNKVKKKKIYRGYFGDRASVIVMVKPEVEDAYALRHVVYHSPTGLAWGYGGSGPADLALSILADYFGESPTRTELVRGKPECWRYHQEFKWAFVAQFSDQGFFLESERIAAWLGETQQTSEDGWLEAAYEDDNGCGLDE